MGANTAVVALASWLPHSRHVETNLSRGAAALSLVTAAGWMLGLSISGKSIVEVAPPERIVVIAVAGALAGVVRAGGFQASSAFAVVYIPVIATLAVVTSGYIRWREAIFVSELVVPAALVLPVAAQIERAMMRWWSRT